MPSPDRPTRPGLVPALALALAMLAWPASATTARGAGDDSSRRPNVVFILADDLGWGDLGCYGHRQLKTPNLDRLASQGTLLTQFYVNGSVCSPSRTAFMTGQYPARHRIHGHLASREQNESRGMAQWLDPEVPNVARLLQGDGYATAHFGKWHLGDEPDAPPPTSYGFDASRVVNGNGPTWDEPDLSFRAKSTAAIVDEALAFIEEHEDGPFYVNLWTLVPHATLNPTEEQMAPYARLGPAGPDFPHRSASEIYYGSVTDLDAQIGRLLEGIDRMGLADDTIVFFSSDNGPEDIHVRNAGHSGIGSAGPFRGRKRSLYEGGIRVPGIVRWPGKVPAGRVEEAVVAGVDWLPTVCSIAGVEVPEGLELDGEDRSTALFGEATPRSTALFWEWRFRVFGEPFHASPILAVRDGDWMLLMNPDGSRVELYDLPRDPTELDNVAEHHPEVVSRLSRRVLSWQSELPPDRWTTMPVGDPIPGRGATRPESDVRSTHTPHPRTRSPSRAESKEPISMRSSRLTLALLVAVVLTLDSPTLSNAQDDSGGKPNIIFIMADDLGWGDLGCYGQDLIPTPHIDRLAAEGMRFTQVYAGSTVCAPSRCCLMTGYHTGHALIRGNARDPLRPEDVTVAEVLKGAGYQTALIGKWGLGEAGSTGVPNKQGFDDFFGYLNQHHAHNYYPDVLWRQQDEISIPGNVIGPDEGVAVDRVTYSHDLFAEEALGWVEAHREGPFFLYLSLTIPHANNEGSRATGNGMEVPDLGPFASEDWPEPEKAKAAMIARMDSDVGRLMATLDDLGIGDDTLVFFTSDNGPHHEGGRGFDPDFFDSNGPLRGIKRDLYEGGIRVPMIARWPGHVPAGVVSDQVWAFWDVLPTLAELAGASGAVPDDIDGLSVLPTLLGPEAAGHPQQEHELLYWEFHEGPSSKQAARMGDWKGVRLSPDGPLELYDLAEDLGEMVDIAADHPEVVATITDAIDAARSESDAWPLRTDRRERAPR